MPDYPCFTCIFCNKLFGTKKSVFDHLDHYLPEYCLAYGAIPRQQGLQYHPLSVLRYYRNDLNRTREIKWVLEPDVLPRESSLPWKFAILVDCPGPCFSATLASY